MRGPEADTRGPEPDTEQVPSEADTRGPEADREEVPSKLLKSDEETWAGVEAGRRAATFTEHWFETEFAMYTRYCPEGLQHKLDIMTDILGVNEQKKEMISRRKIIEQRDE